LILPEKRLLFDSLLEACLLVAGQNLSQKCVLVPMVVLRVVFPPQAGVTYYHALA
jgi:hypothetical protein